MTLYETNILNQPAEWKRLLNTPLPPELQNIRLYHNKIIFVGIGSSYCLACLAKLLWTQYVCTTNRSFSGVEPLSIESYDFVKSKHSLSNNDLVIVFSHRGSKSFSVTALETAKKYGAKTILITGIASPPNHNADFRIETCAQENSEAFTISVTSAIVRIVQWIGLYNRFLLDKLKRTIKVIEGELPFQIQKLPRFTANMVIVGDLYGEIVAREIALKITETSYLPVRSFGLEEFLHGPNITLNRHSSLLIFSSLSEPRRDSLIKYANIVGSEVISIDQEKFRVVQEFGWLAQLLWGQQMASELSKQLKTNPDIGREDEYIYKEAKKALEIKNKE